MTSAVQGSREGERGGAGERDAAAARPAGVALMTSSAASLLEDLFGLK